MMWCVLTRFRVCDNRIQTHCQFSSSVCDFVAIFWCLCAKMCKKCTKKLKQNVPSRWRGTVTELFSQTTLTFWSSKKNWPQPVFKIKILSFLTFQSRFFFKIWWKSTSKRVFRKIIFEKNKNEKYIKMRGAGIRSDPSQPWDSRA